ncbi:unnamed protein product, partial [Prorocentrum cordatum]
ERPPLHLLLRAPRPAPHGGAQETRDIDAQVRVLEQQIAMRRQVKLGTEKEEEELASLKAEACRSDGAPPHRARPVSSVAQDPEPRVQAHSSDGAPPHRARPVSSVAQDPEPRVQARSGDDSPPHRARPVSSVAQDTEPRVQARSGDDSPPHRARPVSAIAAQGRSCLSGPGFWEPLPVCTKCTLGRVVAEEVAESSPIEKVAMQVLARHVVRLGGSGPGLEGAVLRAYRRAPLGCEQWRRWDFLSRPSGLRAYLEEKWRVEQVYARCGRAMRKSDEEVRRGIPLEALVRKTPRNPEVPAMELLEKGKAPNAEPGEKIELSITDIRFAHDSQREHFGHLAKAKASAVQRGVLQLAVELLMGLTDPRKVPKFNVCRHDDLWYTFTGNRRLAALRIASLFAPDLIPKLRLRVCEANEMFFCGQGPFPARYTTGRNGPECAGRWLIIKETGEGVGRVLEGDFGEYGCDLLSLLPLPERRPERVAEGAGPEAAPPEPAGEPGAGGELAGRPRERPEPEAAAAGAAAAGGGAPHRDDEFDPNRDWQEVARRLEAAPGEGDAAAGDERRGGRPPPKRRKVEAVAASAAASSVAPRPEGEEPEDDDEFDPNQDSRRQRMVAARQQRGQGVK